MISCTLSWQVPVQEESLCLDMMQQPSGRKLLVAGAAAQVLLQVSRPVSQHTASSNTVLCAITSDHMLRADCNKPTLHAVSRNHMQHAFILCSIHSQ